MGKRLDRAANLFFEPRGRDAMLPGLQPPSRRGLGGRRVTTGEALTLSAVYAAIAIHGTAMRQLAVKVYDAYGKELDALPSLVRSPDEHISLAAWLEMFTNSLHIAGETFLFVESDDRGRVLNAAILNPLSLSFIEDDGFGNVTKFRLNNRDYGAYRNGGRETIYHSKIMHLADRTHGLGPLQANQDALGGALDASQFANAWFRKGGVPTGTLSTNMQVPDEVSKKVKDQWNEVASHGEGVAILPMGLSYNKTMLTPAEAQFLESQEFYVSQVARIFTMEPSLLNAKVNSGNLTYQNLESAEIRSIRYGLMRVVVEIETALTTLLPRGQKAKLNLDALLRPDTKTRYETHAIGINAGFLLVNEARELENRRPLTKKELADLKPAAPVAPTAPADTTTPPPEENKDTNE